MAYWEYVYNENHHLVACKCSECERVVYENAPYQAYIFCPRCGAKITEQPRTPQKEGEGVKKKELADLAYRLYGNIDQAEQFDITRLFYHCDNKFLVDIIQELAQAVKDNVAERGKRFSTRGENVAADDEELKEMIALAEKAMKGA